MRKSVIAICRLSTFGICHSQVLLNSNAVISLSKVDLSSSIIVIKNERSPSSFDSSDKGIIALKQAKVPDEVVHTERASTSAGTNAMMGGMSKILEGDIKVFTYSCSKA